MRTVKTILLLLPFAAVISSCATELGDSRYVEPAADYREIFRNEKPENINGLFPDKVSVKTKTQTFNSVYEFQLYNGRIYYKDINGKQPELWTILKKTGLPSNRLNRGFEEATAVAEISADSQYLYALSFDGIFYHIRFTDGWPDGGWRWEQDIGFPDKTTLRLPEEMADRRAWSLSRRGEEVLWYEDINGNEHHYGTIGVITNYILMGDGQEIRFADPGLPSDFSHNILGPERGRFIASSMSSSASTIFLINTAGEMYTRLVDFDTVGSDPMLFKYTYDPAYQDDRPGSEYGTNFNLWALPAEDWSRQPPIPLTGQAEITDRITILQNGQGNTARELRVAGSDKTGAPGYYFKQLNDDAWRFNKAPLELSEEDYLDTAVPAPRGESPDRSLSGRLWADGRLIEGIDIQVDGFNLFEGSGTLTASSDAGRLEMKFHPVEMWYYFKRDLPGRDGTPKLFMATIETPDEQVSGLSGYFNAFSGKTFAFTVEAAEGYMIIESASEEGAEIRMLLTEEGGLQISNPDTLRLMYLLRSDETAIDFFNKDLRIPAAERSEEVKRGNLIAAMESNKLYLAKLKAVNEELIGKNISSMLSDFTYNRVEKVFAFSGLDRIDYPKFKTITMHSGVILDRIKSSLLMTTRNKLQLYRYMITHVEKRIEYYHAIASAGGELPVFYETPSEFFAEAGIDFSLLNYDRAFQAEGFRLYTELLDYYPVLIINDKQHEQGYLIEFSDFEKQMSEYLASVRNGGEAESLKLEGTIIDYITDEDLSTEVVCIYENGFFIIRDEKGKILISSEIKSRRQDSAL